MVRTQSIPSKKVIILSSNSNAFSTYRINCIRSYILDIYLKFCEFKYKRVLGYYKNIKETSFVILCGDKRKEHLLNIARAFNQESVLLLDEIGNCGTRKAKLYYLEKNTEEDIGYFHETKGKIAIHTDNYTYDYHTGKYYICSDYETALKGKLI